MTQPAIPTAPDVSLSSRPWIRRLRLLLAIALPWAALHFLVGGTVLPVGLDRPVALAAANSPLLAAIAVALVLIVGAYVSARVAGPAYRGHAPAIIGCALALWVLDGGTMTDWLLLTASGETVGPPTGAAYWPLFGEYLFLAIVMVGVAIAARLAEPRQPDTSFGTLVRQSLGLHTPAAQRRDGVIALGVMTIVIGVLMLILTGPATAKTLHGQVYFAAALSSIVGVFIAGRVVRIREPIWFWPAPILAGLLGMLVAALRPDLFVPVAYRELNSIPAWGLARALPLEMVGVGVAVTLWSLRTYHGVARQHAD